MSVSYTPDKRNRRVGMARGKEGGGMGKGGKGQRQGKRDRRHAPISGSQASN
jgi:hypothetical protein